MSSGLAKTCASGSDYAPKERTLGPTDESYTVLQPDRRVERRQCT